jgi:hypothetical protein
MCFMPHCHPARVCPYRTANATGSSFENRGADTGGARTPEAEVSIVSKWPTDLPEYNRPAILVTVNYAVTCRSPSWKILTQRAVLTRDPEVSPAA